MSNSAPLWTPSKERIAAAPLTAFMAEASQRAGRKFSHYAELHAWSVADREAFWSLVWDFCGVVGDKGERVLVDGDRMPGARFFPDARLNFAENLLRRRGAGDAIVFGARTRSSAACPGTSCTRWSRGCSRLFRALGVKQGDRVAAMMPNMPETIAAMLAAASIGAIWSSCSPDFGEQGVLDRFGQIEPVVLHRRRRLLVQRQAASTSPAKIAEVVRRSCRRVRQVLVVAYLGNAARRPPRIADAP